MLDFMSLDSWLESRLIFMKIHENIFMIIYRIGFQFMPWKLCILGNSTFCKQYKIQLCFKAFLKSYNYTMYWKDDQSLNNHRNLVSISSTLNAQILRTKVLFGSFFYLHVTGEKLPKRRLCAPKTLMKMTPEITDTCCLLVLLPLFFQIISWMRCQCRVKIKCFAFPLHGRNNFDIFRKPIWCSM